MRTSFWPALILTLLVPLANASAARIEIISGIIMLSRGNGYTQIQQITTARVGDSIMARREGSARLVYEDGCTVAIAPGAVVTVRETSPCASALPESGTAIVAIGAGAVLATGLINQIDRVPISP